MNVSNPVVLECSTFLASMISENERSTNIVPCVYREKDASKATANVLEVF